MREAPFLLASHVLAFGNMFSRFVSAPVGQKAAHMPQPEQRPSSITACPQRCVSIMALLGCPKRLSASSSMARRGGRERGSAPVSTAARRVCSMLVSWSKAWSIASSAVSAAASRPKSRADCRNARRSGFQEAFRVARQHAGSLGETLACAALCQVAKMVLASRQVSSAMRFPVAYSQFSQLPQAKRSVLAPADARSTKRLTSMRPMQRTGAIVSGSMAAPAVWSSCSHANATVPPVARIAEAAVRASARSSGFRGESAPVGHADAHVPHPMQRSGRTLRCPSLMLMQPDVHARAHRPHVVLRFRATRQRCASTRTLMFCKRSNRSI